MSQVQKLRSTIAYLTDTHVSCHWVIVIIQGVIIHDRMFVDQQGSIMPMTTHSVNTLNELTRREERQISTSKLQSKY